MIQLEQQQHGEFEGWWVGGVVAYTNYLYPARCGWIKNQKWGVHNRLYKAYTMEPDTKTFLIQPQQAGYR